MENHQTKREGPDRLSTPEPAAPGNLNVFVVLSHRFEHYESCCGCPEVICGEDVSFDTSHTEEEVAQYLSHRISEFCGPNFCNVVLTNWEGVVELSNYGGTQEFSDDGPGLVAGAGVNSIFAPSNPELQTRIRNRVEELLGTRKEEKKKKEEEERQRRIAEEKERQLKRERAEFERLRKKFQPETEVQD